MKQKTPKPLIIKKYENRRLYNTVTSQYINQEQVAQLIRDGHDVHVVDAATGDDITRLVLAQIVLDDAKTPNSVFPLDALRQMIVASGMATQESALRYMKAMMDIYQDAYRTMPSPLNAFGFMPALWPQAGQRPGFPGAENTPNGDAAARAAGGGKMDEMEKLRRRVEELEAALARTRRAERPKRNRKPRRKS